MAAPNEERGSVDGLQDWFCAQLMEEHPEMFDQYQSDNVGIGKPKINYAAKEAGRQFQEKLADLSTSAPTTVNENGGKQSYIPFRFDLMRGILATVLLKLAGVLKHGSKYGEDNWHNISPQEHINHALTHLFSWLQGDDQDDHVSHFVCRASMFAATLEDPRWKRLGPGNYILDPLRKEATQFDTSLTSPFKDLPARAETVLDREIRHRMELKETIIRQQEEREKDRHTNGNLGGARA